MKFGIWTWEPTTFLNDNNHIGMIAWVITWVIFIKKPMPLIRMRSSYKLVLVKRGWGWGGGGGA